MLISSEGLSNECFEEDDCINGFARASGNRVIGQKVFKTEKKSFKRIIDIEKGKIRFRLFEKSGERISWIRFSLKGMLTLVKELRECCISRMSLSKVAGLMKNAK